MSERHLMLTGCSHDQGIITEVTESKPEVQDRLKKGGFFFFLKYQPSS